MLTLRDISKTFQDKTILDNINLSLDNNEVVGLVGPNGAGKTTLLKIITGELQADSGSIQLSDEKLGYLPQHPEFAASTVQQFLMSHIKTEEMYKIESVLAEVQLTDVLQSQLAKSLSGGQKTKLYLASLLLQDPTILLLDEPTNNLDLEGLEWLEKFIKRFHGNVLLTSHDRAFLDNVTDKIVELDKAHLRSYGGNYSFYKEQKALEDLAAQKLYEKSIQEVKRLENSVTEKQERLTSLSKNKKPKDKDKMGADFLQDKAVRKTVQQQKSLETRLDRLEEVEKPDERMSYPFVFQGNIHSSKFIVEAKNITKTYGDKKILQNASFMVNGNRHIWISGRNGSGKSTFLKILAKHIEPDSGTIELGTSIHIGYFNQELAVTDIDRTVLAELQQQGASSTEAYKFAKYMHIEPDMLLKPLSVLSRGQLTKVEFIKLLMGSNQLLILDEPTNHLEIETREQIEEALRDYQGAIIVASHDRYFLESIGIDKEYMLEAGILNEVK